MCIMNASFCLFIASECKRQSHRSDSFPPSILPHPRSSGISFASKTTQLTPFHCSLTPAPSTRPSLSLYLPASSVPTPFPPGEPPTLLVEPAPFAGSFANVLPDSSPPKTLSWVRLFTEDKREGRRCCSGVPAVPHPSPSHELVHFLRFPIFFVNF